MVKLEQLIMNKLIILIATIFASSFISHVNDSDYGYLESDPNSTFSIWHFQSVLLQSADCAEISDDSQTNDKQVNSTQFIDEPHDIFYLMNEQMITIASKMEQKVSEISSAVFVITQEDIRRSGFTSIPETLRMVPGLQVAQVDANRWAISSRGFNDSFADKLLVMIDGRSVYTPFTGGVYWDVQDTLIEDIERIEVIRGPGATIWGANAVNGVINIITKKAEDTQGGFVVAGGGTEERGFGRLRYGGQIGNDIYYRIYAKYFDRDDFVNRSNNRAADEWDMRQGGFRVDWDFSENDTLTMQGDIYDGHTGQTVSLTSPSPHISRDTTDLGRR